MAGAGIGAAGLRPTDAACGLCLHGTDAAPVLKAERIRCKTGQFFGNPLAPRLPAQAIEAIFVRRALTCDVSTRTYKERTQ